MAMPIKTTPGEVIFATEDRVNLKANDFKEWYSMAKTSLSPIIIVFTIFRFPQTAFTVLNAISTN